MQKTHIKPLITLSEDLFFDVFKPIPNHINTNTSWSGCMFETYGDELEFIRRQPAERIWTIVEADGGMAICSGCHVVNRIGYLVASIPTQPDTEYDIICEDLTHESWVWEDAFDTFGFNDGDGIIHTHEVARAIAELGYIATQLQLDMHNTVITSIADISGTELIGPDVRIGYQNPRDYLPSPIVTHLDRTFANHRHNHQTGDYQRR